MSLLTLLLLSAALPAVPQGFDPDPEDLGGRILVVYNSNWPDEDGDGVGDSAQVAEWYARRRHIPASQLVGLPLSPAGISYDGLAGWQAFWDEMVVPLRNHLQANYGPNDILGFVLCYGVPYRINAPNGAGARALDTTLMVLWYMGDRDNPLYFPFGHGDSYFETSPTVPPDKGRFDPKHHLFANTRTYLVSRLDGRDVQHAMELVETAMYGDAYVSPQAGYYQGNAYCDTRYGAYTWQQLSGYPYGHFAYADADKDMAYGRQWMEQPGFPLFWEPYGTEIGESGATWENGLPADTAPAALWYQGWYNFRQFFDVWEWIPGSVACDLDSNSIAGIRDAAPGSFLGESLLRGLTAGAGCIAEPYLSGHPYPEVLQYYLLVQGLTFAEAARVSDPKVLWRNMYVGDFLYQPMRAGKVALLDDQPPPPCQVTVEVGATPDERVFHTFLDTRGALPDVGRLTLHYGPDPAYGSTVTGEDDRPRLFHTTRVQGLGPDELLHYRADYTDPEGNLGPGRELVLHTALASQPVLARVSSSATSVPAGTPFDVELVWGARDGVGSLTVASATVTAAALGWQQRDILPLLPGLGAVRYPAADDTVTAVRFTVPGTLPPGSYLLEVDAASPAGSDHDSVQVDVY